MASAAAVLAYEFGAYAYHRAMHRFTPLWRALHQTHHSAERLDVSGAFWFSLLDMIGWTVLPSLALTRGHWREAGLRLEDFNAHVPLDVLEMFAGHQIDFMRGDSRKLHDRIARVQAAWDTQIPGWLAVLGMYAFGLEETVDLRRWPAHSGAAARSEAGRTAGAMTHDCVGDAGPVIAWRGSQGAPVTLATLTTTISRPWQAPVCTFPQR